ncbi:MAG: hypothetical protein LBV54_06295, partial [Puniceicoccales bacterium]|nr:hypothetical protein [Puniceicoccales bacterium]
MKTLRSLLALLALVSATTLAVAEIAPATSLSPIPPHPSAPAGATISLHATVPSPGETVAPAFATATLNQTITVDGTTGGTPHTVVATAELSARVLQGEVSRFTFAFTGKESVGKVTGDNVASWETRRTADGVRLLDIFTTAPLKPNTTFSATITFSAYTLAGRTTDGAEGAFAVPVLSLPKSDAITARTGAPAHIVLDGTVNVATHEIPDAKLHTHDALFRVSLAPDATGLRFTYDTTSEKPALLRIAYTQKPSTLEQFVLDGTFEPKTDSLTFTLSAIAKVRTADALLPILQGPVAVIRESGDSDASTTPSANPRLTLSGGGYALQFDKPGEYPVKLHLVAKLDHKGDTTTVLFTIPGVPIAPITLRGFPADTRFSTTDDMPALSALKTEKAPGSLTYTGYLSPQGRAAFSWTKAKPDTDARLFFSTEETTEITVRPGLLRQNARYRYQILQGKLDSLRFSLSGDGEILRVTGEDVLSWKVEETGKKETGKKSAAAAPRALVVRLAQPKTGDYALTIDARTPLGDFPLDIAPLSLAPQDGVRHSGFVQVANEGAVRLESTPRSGLTQIAPALFPANRAFPDGTQRFVYRVAGAQTALSIHADNILPEVNVSALALYRITESDLFIDLEAELDVREAPLQEITVSV